MSLEDLSRKLESARMLLPDEARRLAHLSAGRTGYAMRLADAPDEADRIVSIAEDGIELLQEDTIRRFAYAASFKDVKKRGALRETLQIWQSLFRDLLLLSSAGDETNLPITYLDLQERMDGLSKKAEPAVFRKTLSEINRMIGYLNANVNLQMLLENLLLGFPAL